jgi:hypothetical protein
LGNKHPNNCLYSGRHAAGAEHGTADAHVNLGLLLSCRSLAACCCCCCWTCYGCSSSSCYQPFSSLLLLLLSLHEAWFLRPLVHLPTRVILLLFTAAAATALLLLPPLLLLPAGLSPIVLLPILLPLFAFFFISTAAAALLLLLPVSAELRPLLLGCCFSLPPFHLLVYLVMEAARLQDDAHASNDTLMF